MTTTSDMVRIRGSLAAGQSAPPARWLGIDRVHLWRTSHDNLLRLARFMGGDPARLPTCACDECRAVLIEAVWRATR